MKKLILLLTLLILTSGCSKWTYNPDKYELTKFEAFVAYVFNGHPKFEPTPDPINPVKCGKCDKDGKVLSGDGIIKIPCICGSNCKCNEKENGAACDKIPNRQIYYFGHNLTCQYCIMTKDHVFPKLREMNPPWKIGTEDTDFIKTFEWTEELGNQYDVGSLPTYILFVDKQEIARHTGYIDHIKLSHFYYTGDINIKKAKD